jgi:hypothetical protein
VPRERVGDRDAHHGSGVRGDKGEHRAAEAAADHPGAQCSRGYRRVDGDVSVRPGDLEVVAQRPMSFGKQGADLAVGARVGGRGAEQAHGRPDPGIVGDDVPCPAAQDGIGEPAGVVGVRQAPEERHPELTRGLLAFCPPPGVVPAGVRVPGPRVDDEQPGAGRTRVERNLGDLQRSAVQEQGMPGLAEQGRGLVHDPGRHANEIVLSPARDFDELAARDGQTCQPGQRERR